jgi:hypothetical protein
LEIAVNPVLIFVLIVFALIGWVIYRARKSARQRETRRLFIETYPFPRVLRFKLEQAYPHLSHEQTTMVLEGLRTWFRMINEHRRANFGMPSVAVDTAWHEFILLTQQYADFCQQAFGRFLHHAPTNGDQKAKSDGLARTYGLGATAALGVVGLAGIAGATALSGRDLFSLDQQLGIPGGNEYSPEKLESLQHRYSAMTASSSSSDSGGSDSGNSTSSKGDATWGDGTSDGTSGCGSGSGGSGASGGGSDGGGSSCGGGCGGGGGC